MSGNRLRTSRRMRALEREFVRAKRNRNIDPLTEVCVLCQEPLEPSPGVLATTVCGHVFHGRCYASYLEHTNNELCDGDVNSITLLCTFLNTHAGPPCPICKRQFCMLHHLPHALMDEEIMKHIGDVWRLDMDTLRMCFKQHTA